MKRVREKAKEIYRKTGQMTLILQLPN